MLSTAKYAYTKYSCKNHKHQHISLHTCSAVYTLVTCQPESTVQNPVHELPVQMHLVIGILYLQDLIKPYVPVQSPRSPHKFHFVHNHWHNRYVQIPECILYHICVVKLPFFLVNCFIMAVLDIYLHFHTDTSTVEYMNGRGM